LGSFRNKTSSYKHFASTSTIRPIQLHGTEVKIKFSVEGTSDAIGAGISNIAITGYALSSATLVATPVTLSGFNYIVGSGPSAQQSFDLVELILMVPM
jgi:hypothetical protein